MTTTISPSPAALAARATSGAAPADQLGTDLRRRRAHAARLRALTGAGSGAALLAAPAQQQLPFAIGASVSASRGLLLPIGGAVLGMLLLGLPGALIGGLAGWFIGRR